MSEATALAEPISSFIGENASFNGEFILQGSLRIDGAFSGKIITEGKVIVGPRGHVKTNIKARQVIVAGTVDGNVYSLDVVQLLEGSTVRGDIIASNLVMDEGVLFEGRAVIRKIVDDEDFFKV